MENSTDKFDKILEELKKIPTTNNTGLTFTGLLTILFIGLKLTGYISWSWWWVLAPVWIPVILAIILVLIILAVMCYAVYKMD